MHYTLFNFKRIKKNEKGKIKIQENHCWRGLSWEIAREKQGERHHSVEKSLVFLSLRLLDLNTARHGNVFNMTLIPSSESIEKY